MPIFEYRCRDCEIHFERVVLSPKAVVVCSSCGSRRIEKLPSSFGIAGVARVANASGGGKCSGCSGGSCSTCH